ncbi:MAG: hypothetical protein IJU95_05805, partial [Treponema sp.]|nr:hypothetical protein [Treponema sp.]
WQKEEQEPPKKQQNYQYCFNETLKNTPLIPTNADLYGYEGGELGRGKPEFVGGRGRAVFS